MNVNINGSLVPLEHPVFSFSESFLNASALIEEQMFFKGLECEDFEAHYFSIMASMRIFRRSIPMGYTPEFLLKEIRKTIQKNIPSSHSLVQFYSGIDASSSPLFYISVKSIEANHFQAQTLEEIDVFKDFFWHSDYLSGIRVNLLPVQVVAKAYCKDHAYADCILINERKELVMTISGMIFLRFGQTIKTPNERSGVYRDALRTQIMKHLKSIESYEIEECSLNPFDIQRADEFVVISFEKGLFAVKNYRKTAYKDQWLNLAEQKLSELI